VSCHPDNPFLQKIKINGANDKRNGGPEPSPENLRAPGPGIWAARALVFTPRKQTRKCDSEFAERPLLQEASSFPNKLLRTQNSNTTVCILSTIAGVPYFPTARHRMYMRAGKSVRSPRKTKTENKSESSTKDTACQNMNPENKNNPWASRCVT
jgi:hypothetical protein